ncbi:MAG: hypothetical protein OEZ06_07885 [Myxococcales bacterium]|nr:hypothetical protein [Myxococcales bacterium]
MTRGRLYGLSTLLLLATAPWPFSAGHVEAGSAMPMPPWALYSLGMTLLYAVSMAYFLKRYWSLSADGETEAMPTSDGRD